MNNHSTALKMSSFVRIRLSFQRSLPLAEAQNCWFLFDTSTCSTIADLEYLIKERFGGQSKRERSFQVINLYLDDYLLPSQEKIEIIQQNDNIRVELEQASKKHSRENEKNFKDVRTKVKTKQKTTVLPVNRDKSKKKLKRKSSCPPASYTEAQNQSDEMPKGKSSVKYKNSDPSEAKLGKSNVAKRKNDAEPLKSNAKKSKTSTNRTGDVLVSKDVVPRENFFSETSISTDSLMESSKDSGPSMSHSKSHTSLNGIKLTALKADGKNSKHSGQGTKSKSLPRSKGTKGKDANAVTSKSSALQERSKGKSVAKPSSSSLTSLLSSITRESRQTEDSERVLTKAANKKYVSRTSNEKEHAKSGRLNAKKSNGHSKMEKMSSSLSSSSLSSSSSSSSPSSSENEEDSASREIFKEADTLPYPLSSPPLQLSSSSLISSAHGSNQGDNTVPYVKKSLGFNSTEKTKDAEMVKNLQRTRRSQNGKSGSGHIRFDSEDDTSEEEEESCLEINITGSLDSSVPYQTHLTASSKDDQTSSILITDKKQEPSRRDYSLCTPLHGPPRSRDKIAYKVLELSASYTPEVSDYKEGTVLSYDPISGAVSVELTKESLKKTQGDGNVSRKFELDDGESEEADSEVHFKFGRQSEMALACKYSRFSDPPSSPNNPAKKDSETAVFAGF